jgi:hypothetical protein
VAAVFWRNWFSQSRGKGMPYNEYIGVFNDTEAIFEAIDPVSKKWKRNSPNGALFRTVGTHVWVIDFSFPIDPLLGSDMVVVIGPDRKEHVEAAPPPEIQLDHLKLEFSRNLSARERSDEEESVQRRAGDWDIEAA